jgi:hypothetical protein
MSIMSDAMNGLSIPQRRVLEAFYNGRLGAGKLMEALRCADAGVPITPPQAAVAGPLQIVVARRPSTAPAVPLNGE